MRVIAELVITIRSLGWSYVCFISCFVGVSGLLCKVGSVWFLRYHKAMNHKMVLGGLLLWLVACSSSSTLLPSDSAGFDCDPQTNPACCGMDASCTICDDVTTGLAPDQCRYLESLFVTTGGNNWTNKDGWRTDNKPCDWFGVSCNANVVGRIELSSNNLVGSMPRGMEALTEMTALSLADNQLTGSIPSQIGQLERLGSLVLSDNQLTGSIPPQIGDLSRRLIAFSLANNQLSGEIPKEIGNLVNITSLQLNNNQLSGEIPKEIGNLLSLQELNLFDNQLTGSIPTELTSIRILQSIRLQSNQLTGAIPQQVTNLIALRHLVLSGNGLSGEVPSGLKDLNLLDTLLLAGNSCFTSSDAALTAFLEARDPDWNNGC